MPVRKGPGARGCVGCAPVTAGHSSAVVVVMPAAHCVQIGTRVTDALQGAYFWTLTIPCLLWKLLQQSDALCLHKVLVSPRLELGHGWQPRRWGCCLLH